MDIIYIYIIIILMISIRPYKNEYINNDIMSPLGKWLRSPEHSTPPKIINNNYINNPILIHVWKFGPKLENRHIKRYHENNRYSPWDECSVNNCKLSYDPNDFYHADAILFHLHWMTNDDAKNILLLSQKNRRKEQIWIFLTDESPINTNIYHEYNGIFNWSMNYRIDSDIPVPYGRTIHRNNTNNIQDNLDNILKSKTKFIAVMGSNCANSEINGSIRWQYVEQLVEYLPGQVDIYGVCLDGNVTACPGHFTTDCPLLNDYKFYLAFENSNCQQYITEKTFWNAYSKFAIPIIMGPPINDCNKLLPPHSFIHVDDFPSSHHLADYLLMIDLSDNSYYQYHSWRNDYIIMNEHGYFGSPSRHYCRLCEGLNYNSIKSPKIYWNVNDYWNKYDQCSHQFNNSL